MTAGVIVFVDRSPNAPELSADVLAADDVLLVGDAGVFDEDFEEPRYLAIGDDLVPHEYGAAVNDDAVQQSVTLAADAGTDYEAGLPVYLWDPEAEGDDKRVVEYEAQVRLAGETGTIPATVRHALVPLAGVETLDGASVTLEEDEDGEWFVATVHGRTPSIGAAYVDVPATTAFVDLSPETLALSGVWTILPGWMLSATHPSLSLDGDYLFGIHEPGVYLAIATVRFAANGTGSRAARISIYDPGAGTSTPISEVFYAAASSGTTQIQLQGVIVATGDTYFDVRARQNSGSDLNIQCASPEDTHLELVRIA